MSVTDLLIQGALTAVSIAFPEAAPAIAIAVKLEPYLVAGLPLIKSAIQDGPVAWQAAKKAAPGLFSHLQDLADVLKTAGGSDQPADDIEVAQLASHVAGVDPPGWAHEDTQRWWDRAGAGTQS